MGWCFVGDSPGRMNCARNASTDYVIVGPCYHKVASWHHALDPNHDRLINFWEMHATVIDFIIVTNNIC